LHRPALNRADQRAIFERREAKPLDRVHAGAELIGGALAAVGAEGQIEQSLDVRGGDRGEGNEQAQWKRRSLPDGRGAFNFLQMNVKQIRVTVR